MRTTFTTKEEAEETTATLEAQYENTERSQYVKYDDTRRVLSHLFDHTNGVNPSTTPGYSIRLNGSDNERNGIARSLSVMPGDKIVMQVFGKYYDPNTPQTNQTAWENLVGLITQVTNAAQTVVVDGVGYTSGALRIPPATGVLTDPNESTAYPKAHLNWATFDRDWKFLDGGAKQLQGGAEDGTDVPFAEISKSIEIKEPGYVYIWLSNTSAQQRDVFFDDFKVRHTKSPVVQQDEYYPFGLTFNSYQRENGVLNKWKFQGQEHVDVFGLNWDSFKWRNHQPDIGRFFNVDPLSEKYYYNSPYAFSENRVIAHRELEGLESVGINGNDMVEAMTPKPEPLSLGQRFVNWIIDAENNLPREKPTGQGAPKRSGFALIVFTSDGFTGEGEKYQPKARSATAKVLGIDIELINIVAGVVSKSLKRESVSTPGERTKAGAEGANATEQTVEEINKTQNEGDTQDSTITITKNRDDPQKTDRTATSNKTGESKVKVLPVPLDKAPLN